MQKIARQLRVFPAAIFFAAWATPVFAESPEGVEPANTGSPNATEAGAFFDEYFNRTTRRGQPAGAVAIYVHDGKSVIRAYGETETGAPIGPSETSFPLGNITRVLTATALIQLLGDRAPDRPIRNFLPTDVQKVLRADAPALLTEDLLASSSGIANQHIDLYFRGPPEEPAEWPDQAAFLVAHKIQRVAPPGAAAWVSAPAYGLVGAAIEAGTGRRFPEVMDREVLPRLGMNRSTFGSTSVSTGTAPLPPFTRDPLYSRLPAANGLFAPAGDIVRLLNYLISEESARLREVKRRPADLATGHTFGLREGRQKGRRFLYQDSDHPGTPGRLLLTPDGRAGLFVLGRVPDPRWMEEFTAHFLHRFFPGSEEPAAGPGEIDLAPLEGTYAFAGSSRYSVEKFAEIFAALKVKRTDQDTLSIKPEIAGDVCGLGNETFFRPVRPGLLRSVPARSGAPEREIYIAYRPDPGRQGEASPVRLYCDLGGRITFERLAWHAYPGLHFRLGLLVLGCGLTLFFLGGRLKDPDPLTDRLRRLARLTGGLIGLTLALLVPAVFWLGRVDGTAPFAEGIPLWTRTVLAAGLFTAGLSSTLTFLTLRAVFQRGGPGTGLYFPVATIGLSACFLAILLYWNLLGFQY